MHGREGVAVTAPDKPVPEMTGQDMRALARRLGEEALSLQEGMTSTETAYYLADKVQFLASVVCEAEARIGRAEAARVGGSPADVSDPAAVEAEPPRLPGEVWRGRDEDGDWWCITDAGDGNFGDPFLWNGTAWRAPSEMSTWFGYALAFDALRRAVASQVLGDTPLREPRLHGEPPPLARLAAGCREILAADALPPAWAMVLRRLCEEAFGEEWAAQSEAFFQDPDPFAPSPIPDAPPVPRIDLDPFFMPSDTPETRDAVKRRAAGILDGFTDREIAEAEEAARCRIIGELRPGRRGDTLGEPFQIAAALVVLFRRYDDLVSRNIRRVREWDAANAPPEGHNVCAVRRAAWLALGIDGRHRAAWECPGGHPPGTDERCIPCLPLDAGGCGAAAGEACTGRRA